MLIIAVVTGVRADTGTVILHEFVPADPKEDIDLAATTPDGALPAAIETQSGVVGAPDTTRMPTPTEKAYSEATQGRASDRTYRADDDTRRPNVSRYDDPFTPATAPYKRLSAFDAVLGDFTLAVADPTFRPVPVGGSVLNSEDAFFGDLTVDLVPGSGVLIPTVGPGARIVKVTVVPPATVDIVRDSAENWYARSNLRTRVRIIEELAIPRDAFGGVMRISPRSYLPAVRPVPDNVRKSVQEVVRAIGVDPGGTVREIVTALVAYFRAFEDSQDPPAAGPNIYARLALSKKGVCRHRAYAFVVTALGMGIPARMVVNEAHAWVEVHDGVLWRRIDLGGAANFIEQEPSDAARPAHRTPPDPFPWPAQNDSGQESARRSRPDPNGAGPTGSTGNPWLTPSARSALLAAPPGTSTVDQRNLPPAKVTIGMSDPKVLRGSPLRVEGAIASGQVPCSHVRVDVVLLDSRGQREMVIGSLSTDDTGHFQGAVVMPLEVPVGDYELVVTSPGDGLCGAGRSGP